MDSPSPPPGADRGERLRGDLAALRLDREAAAVRRGVPRAWILAGLVMLVLLAGYLLFRAIGGSPARVEVAAVETLAAGSRTTVPVLSGSGYLVPAQETISVGARVSGRIERYLVEEGDGVRAGDPLVKIEDRPYRATVEENTAARASAKARQAYAESELGRARRLYEGRVVSRDFLEQKEREASVARAEVARIEASLSRARTDLEDTVVRSPTEGVVLETTKRPGEIAVPGGFAGSGDLVRLADLHEVRAELDVNEADLPLVQLGQPAEVTPDAFPDARYEARVVKLAPKIDRDKGTRKVEVRLLDPDARLLPDMSARVTFLRVLESGDAEGSALVPGEAVRRGQDGAAYVWLVRNGRALRAPVAIVSEAGEHVLIEGSLEPGTQVVTGEPPERDGARVEIARQGGGTPPSRQDGR